MKLRDIDQVLRQDISFDRDQIAAAIDCLATCGVGGIATHYGLDGPGSNCGGGARFYSPVKSDPGAHPASCTVGYPVTFRGVALTTYKFIAPRLKKE